MSELTVEDYPLEAEKYRELIEAAILEWTSGAHASFRLLVGGYSGSVVLTVELTQIARSERLQSGKYIIKGSEHSEWSDLDTEYTAHERAEEFNRAFAKQHMVGLKEKFDSDDGYVILYEVAGHSLDNYGHTQTKESPQFGRICSQLVTETLTAWVPKDPTTQTVIDLFNAWLDYRLEPDSNLRKIVKEHYQTTFPLVDNRPLANPIQFIDFARKQDSLKQKAFDALVHGDLHGGNIITHSTSPSAREFILIDLALSKVNYAGFDQAYLEMARVIYALSDHDPVVIVNALAAVEDDSDNQMAPEGASTLVTFLRQIREAIADWQRNTWPEWGDEINRQFLLARIAAGLNWANKPWSNSQADQNSKRLALYFAGWHAFKYQEQYSDFGDAFRNAHSSGLTSSISTNSENTTLLKRLNLEASSFSDSDSRYVLVSGGLGECEKLEALGKIPWSVVVDLDPVSETKGLYNSAASILAQLRSVHIFSVNPDFRADTDNGTVWNFSSGYPTKGELQRDLGEWSLHSIPALDNFLTQFVAASSGKQIVCLLLPGTSIDMEHPTGRTEEVCKLLWRKSGGSVKFLLVDPIDLGATYLKPVNVNVGTQAFIDMVASSLGTAPSQTAPTLPGQLTTTRDGERLVIETKQSEVPFDRLRVIEENFHVLHSRIESKGADSQNSFWRGNPPTWAGRPSCCREPRMRFSHGGS